MPATSRRGITGVIVVVSFLVVTAIMVVGIYYWTRRDPNELKEPPLTHVAARAKFDHIVLEQGEVESSSNVEVVCEVESRGSGTAILWVIEEGTQVKKGELLVELDSSVLESELVQQRIVEATSQARVITAQSTLDQAEVGRDEYLEGTFKQEEKTIESEILVAEEALSRAKDTAKYSEELAAQGFNTPQQLRADKFAVKQREVELNLAQQKLKTLRDITQRKMLIQLNADIAAADAQLNAEKENLSEEVKKRAVLEKQIENCKIYAPDAGQVVHANRVSSRGGNAEFVVEPGAMVRERQTIIRLPDPEQMRVTAKINEARVPLVEAGLPVTISIGAIEMQLSGHVTKVNKYAEPTSFFSSQVKEYATYIDISNPPPILRSGMTAEVEIYVAQLDNVLQVPVQAVLEEKGHYFSIITHGGSDFETREIKLGASNEKFLVITEGIDVGDELVLNPRQYRDRMEIPDLPDVVKDVPERKAMAEAGGDGGKGPGKSKGGPGKGGKGAGKGGGFGGGDGPPSPASIVARIFEASDANKDGKLSPDELSGADPRQQEMMKTADTNGDGDIDRRELTAAIAKRFADAGMGGSGRGGPPGGGRGGPPGGGRE